MSGQEEGRNSASVEVPSLAKRSAHIFLSPRVLDTEISRSGHDFFFLSKNINLLISFFILMVKKKVMRIIMIDHVGEIKRWHQLFKK